MRQRRQDGTVLLVDGKTSIIIDERTRPVVFTTWFGEATERIVDGYFDWYDERLANARATNERLVLVNDTFAIERPTPMVRRRIAERMKKHATPPESVVGSVVVIENALVRGAVTALGWILPSLSDSEFVGSIDEAIDRALALLDEAGLPRPADFSRATYQRPSRP